MFRIVLATSHHYYVQENTRNGWNRRGGYHVSKRDAQQLVRDLKRDEDVPFPGERRSTRGVVVEYSK
jgi:hypothetical protein